MVTPHVPIAEPHKPMCGAKTRKVGPDGQRLLCQRRPMKGQWRCDRHGGKTPAALEAAQRRLAVEKVRAELVRLGVPVPVDPIDALLGQLCEAAGNVAYLRGEVQRQQQQATEREWPSSQPLTYITDKGSAGVAPLVLLYNEERDRTARLAKLALDAGVNERVVALAERLGASLQSVLEAALADAEWGLNAGQVERGRRVLGRHLQAVE